jgi:hypothetical protein
MSSAKVAAACAVAALALSACGSSSKPVAGSVISTTGKKAGRGVIDDPRTKHMECLQQQGVPVARVGQTGLQIGSPPAGPTVKFEPTPGAAQDAQISDQTQGAEVIGSALLYTNGAPDKLLKVVEDCLAIGVKG